MMCEFEQGYAPDQAEKNRSIARILERGMPEPRRLSVALGKRWNAVGVRGLFFGLGDCIFLALLACGLLWLCLFAAFGNHSSPSYVVTFFASPFLYAALHLLTTWKEIMSGTYELMMTCQYNLRQVTALRMLVFGGISVVVTVMASVGVAALLTDGISILRLLGVSFSALFLFAALSLFVERRGSAPGIGLVTPLLWVSLFLALLLLGDRGERLLFQVPTAVFWGVSAVSLVFYIRALEHLYFESKEGAISHAVS